MTKATVKAPRPGSLAALDASWVAPAVRRGTKLPGLETGFTKLDDALGGLRGLVVLGGLRKIGKTTLSLQLLCEVAQRNGVPCLLASFEMTGAELVPIFRACRSGLARRDIELGKLDSSRKEWGAWSAALAEFGDLVDVRGSSERFGLSEVEAWIQDAKMRVPGTTPFVIVDSLHALVLSGSHAGRSEKEGLDHAVFELKSIVSREDCCVLALSHVTKASRGDAEKSAFLGSAGIEHHADTALILSGQMTPGARVPRKLSVVASRVAPPCELLFDYHQATGRFQEKGR